MFLVFCKLVGIFVCVVCLIIWWLVKLIKVCGLVKIMFFFMVKLVVILFVVGLVKIIMYSKLVVLCLVIVVEILVICIKDIIFFCIWVFLEVVKRMIGCWFFVVFLNRWVIFLLVIVFKEFIIKVGFMIFKLKLMLLIWVWLV